MNTNAFADFMATFHPEEEVAIMRLIQTHYPHMLNQRLNSPELHAWLGLPETYAALADAARAYPVMGEKR
jgi:hypothetical protein